MNPEPSPNRPASPDPALSNLLRTWEVDATLPHHFAREVRQRIQGPPTQAASAFALPPVTWLTILTRFVSLLQRPGFAIAYVAAGVVLGGLAGSQQAHTRSMATPSTPSTPADPQVRYVASIDPYQMPRPPIAP